jgi:hypothetical protein
VTGGSPDEAGSSPGKADAVSERKRLTQEKATMTEGRMDVSEDVKTQSLRKARIRGKREKSAFVEKRADSREKRLSPRAQFEENAQLDEESQLDMEGQLDEESQLNMIAQLKKGEEQKKKEEEEKKKKKEGKKKKKEEEQRKKKDEIAQWKEEEELWDDEFPPDEIAQWKEGEEQQEEEEWEEEQREEEEWDGEQHKADMRKMSCELEKLAIDVKRLTAEKLRAREFAREEALRAPREAIKKLPRSREEVQTAPMTAVVGVLSASEDTKKKWTCRLWTCTRPYNRFQDCPEFRRLNVAQSAVSRVSDRGARHRPSPLPPPLAERGPLCPLWRTAPQIAAPPTQERLNSQGHCQGQGTSAEGQPTGSRLKADQ